MHILIIEDDVSLAEGIRKILESEQFTVDAIGSGSRAAAAVAAERFDLVILDIGLPGLDGFEVLRRLRAARFAAPVLILTARDEIEDRVRGLNLGADDYMPKPFAMQELVARVRALIRRSQSRAQPRIEHGALTLDMDARRAFIRGQPVDLLPREWAVLEVLLANVEKIVSKDVIIQSVCRWGEDMSQNAIESYVSRLRAKLEPAGVKIRTVRGFGYMLEEKPDDPR